MAALASELIAQVKILCGGSTSDMLIQLTNVDSSATTINDTVLTQAANLAIGEFRWRTILEPDTSTPNYTHISLLTEGVLYFLENAKSRDVGFTSERGKNFRLGCDGLKKGVYFPAVTGSTLQPSVPLANRLPDMDVSRTAFRQKTRQKLNREYNNE